MVIRVSLSRRRLLIAAACFLVVAGSIALLLINRAGNQTQTQYYASQLDRLKTDVNTINTLGSQERSESSLSDQLNTYNDSLVGILDNCREIDEHSKNSKDDPALKEIDDRVEKVNKLCADLSGVAEYARKQSESTRAFITFNSGSLSEQKNLASFQELLAKTKASQTQLSKDPLNDPAIPELITLIEQLEKRSKEAGTDPGTLGSLVLQVNTHQTNFLNARTYFWANTIRIDDLLRSVSNLQSQFVDTKQ